MTSTSFNQNKLTKSEWESIEIRVDENKMEILQVILAGFNNVNISFNKTKSLISFLKIENSKTMNDYLYNIYFSQKIQSIISNNNISWFSSIKINPKVKISKADTIRISQNNNINCDKIYEYICIDFIEKMYNCKKKENLKWIYYYFTLCKITVNSICNINSIVANFIMLSIKNIEEEVQLNNLIYNSVQYIEKNENIIKYSDIKLYSHQKEIFTAFRCIEGRHSLTPKLVLYIAPTGTGKTLTPIGLSESYKVIYVCASRHIGLALAKSSISINKKIAFAFGCNSSDDIKLHYSAAKEYTKNRRSGGIGKVDNSVGDKVEIIICDVKSYLPAMYYMLAFFKKENIISYFDEPTIFLDYETHPLHETIHKNWKDNLIPNVVLSSATLPKRHELTETIADFQAKFLGSEIINIRSHDCLKTISLIDKNGFVTVPHYLSDNYDEVVEIACHCIENPTLLRYLDFQECISFIKYLEENSIIDERYFICNNFYNISDINMETIKFHYLKLLQNIHPDNWSNILTYFKINRTKYIKPKLSSTTVTTSGIKIKKISSINEISSKKIGAPIQKINSCGYDHSDVSSINKDGNFGIKVTTNDAFTLCSGPTLYLAEDIDKIAKFCIHQANIPSIIMDDIVAKINFNNEIASKIKIFEDELEDIQSKKETKDSDGEKKISDKIKLDNSKDVGAHKISEELEILYSNIKSVSINDMFIPNTIEHLKKWTSLNDDISDAFTSNISDEIIIKIMALNVSYFWKMLLLLGVGVFSATNTDVAYNEIIKELADQQKLYLIIASSNYIYGTNYQFCHLYIGKDLTLTQEKIIQSLGRVGRENIQQKYSIRFRSDETIKTLFSNCSSKPEVQNMNRLLTSNDLSF